MVPWLNKSITQMSHWVRVGTGDQPEITDSKNDNSWARWQGWGPWPCWGSGREPSCGLGLRIGSLFAYSNNWAAKIPRAYSKPQLKYLCCNTSLLSLSFLVRQRLCVLIFINSFNPRHPCAALYREFSEGNVYILARGCSAADARKLNEHYIKVFFFQQNASVFWLQTDGSWLDALCQMQEVHLPQMSQIFRECRH